MRRLIFFILLCLTIIACEEKKIIVDIWPSPYYHSGTYRVLINPKTDSSEYILQNIEWVFTDIRFFCSFDTTEQTQIICDFSGNYECKGDSIEFFDLIISPGDCNKNLVAEGKFEFARLNWPFKPEKYRIYQLSKTDYGVIEKTIELTKSNY